MNLKKPTIKKTRLTGFSLLVSFLLPSLLLAKGGGVDTSGGGDYRSLQIVSYANALVPLLNGLLKRQEIVLGNEFNLNNFQSAINKTKISFTSQRLLKDGIEKDFLNFPNHNPPEIFINNSAWEKVADGARRGAIIFHEYLNIMGIQDSNFQISNQLYNNPTLNLLLNHIDLSALPDDGKEHVYAFNCRLFDHDKLIPNALGKIGNEQNSDITNFISRNIRQTDNGMLIASVDAMSDMIGNVINNISSKVKGPALRITIGYGSNFMGPPLKPLLQIELKVSPDMDVYVLEPSEAISIRCQK